MPPLASRNLFYDKVKFAVTLTGVSFSVALVATLLGVFIGFCKATTDIIDKAGADLWVAAKGTAYFETALTLNGMKLRRVRTVPGVAEAEGLFVGYTTWKRNDGQVSPVLLMGFDTTSWLGGPWNIVEGFPEDIRMDKAVAVESLYMKKLGINSLGDQSEINDRTARVVALTFGVRTFTTLPYIFTSRRNAMEYMGTNADVFNYLLIKAAPGADLEVLKARVEERISGVDVMAKEEFMARTRNYWMLSTGAGASILFTACLGMLVGGVVISQTIYSTTMEHIREFGTLKAIGASNAYIHRIIVKQALISAVIGYAIGMGATLLIAWRSRTMPICVSMPFWLAALTLLLTALVCVVAAMVSINKVTKIDPAMVFKQ